MSFDRYKPQIDKYFQNDLTIWRPLNTHTIRKEFLPLSANTPTGSKVPIESSSSIYQDYKTTSVSLDLEKCQIVLYAIYNSNEAPNESPDIR